MQRCVGCQVIGEKQDEIKDEPDPHGKKITLIPVAVHAAIQLERELNRKTRRRRSGPDDE